MIFLYNVNINENRKKIVEKKHFNDAYLKHRKLRSKNV